MFHVHGCSTGGHCTTYVAQCQGVTQPCMMGFDPRLHAAVVLDEPSRRLVDACKVFLQASIEGTFMYQSPTQRFTRWMWMYQVPLIVCTNEWIQDKDKDANAKWIRENQCHVAVSDYLYDRPAEAPQAESAPGPLQDATHAG